MPAEKLTFKQQMEGFPVRQMLVICIIRFSEPLAFSSLFPYLYFMIRDFKIADKEEDISKYSGYLASSFAFCQFLFAVRWGKLSDKIGRKFILLIGLFGTATSLLLFGFSQNYWQALVARSIAGILNGNVAVLRTVIGEIATERRHQAIAFSTLPLLFNFGSIIGPAIGGSKYFTHPKKDSPYKSQDFESQGLQSFYEHFIRKYPYALSNIVVAAFLIFSLVCGFLFLEETHDVYKYRKDYGVELGDWLLAKVGITAPERPWTRKHHSHYYHQIDNPSPTISPEPLIASTPTENSPLLPTANIVNIDEDQLYKPSYSNAFTPRVITVITGNFIISLHNVTYNEFLPIFLAARFQKDKLKFPFTIEGGFGLDSNYIGTLFSSTGIMGMLIILVIFPWLDRKLGTINGYRLSVSIFPIVYFLVPFTIFTLNKFNPNFPVWATPVMLYTLTSLKTLASATGMPQVMLLNHRAAHKEHRAYVNSATMSIISLARFTGPIVFGYLMSLSDKLSMGQLTWWVMSLMAAVGMVQSYWMEEYDEDEDEKVKPNEELNDESNESPEPNLSQQLQQDFTAVEVEDETQTSIH
ncbi:major facilitator superfamily domain-containing protein [Scheffersomyces coipomensis]|uniref:major facilitator superfamily domain-containing protein n=1 Tax=Scheffersomyces coipomensis TaxID=1788519 RepID=UPI00315DA662